MTLLFKFMPAGISSTDTDTIVTCSTSDQDRQGDIVDQVGISLTNFRTNPIVLWQHDTSMPIARASEIGLVNGKLTARVKWPAAGISPRADEVRGLVKASVISAVSIGFTPIEKAPIDPANPRGPQRYLKSELCEFSFVSVPANPNALVVQRSRKDGRVLSGANSEKLQQAHDAAENCRALVADVLSGAGTSDEGKARRLRDLDAVNLRYSREDLREMRLREARILEIKGLSR